MLVVRMGEDGHGFDVTCAAASSTATEGTLEEMLDGTP